MILGGFVSSPRRVASLLSKPWSAWRRSRDRTEKQSPGSCKTTCGGERCIALCRVSLSQPIQDIKLIHCSICIKNFKASYSCIVYPLLCCFSASQHWLISHSPLVSQLPSQLHPHSSICNISNNSNFSSSNNNNNKHCNYNSSSSSNNNNN